MASKQKSTEGKVVMYFNQWFVDELSTYSSFIMTDILNQLFDNEKLLPETNGYSQFISGVVKQDKPFYFEVEYLKQQDERPTYLDLVEIELDEYLDAINNKKTLKENERTTTKNTEIKGYSKYSFSIRLNEENSI
jgi:hypothetical protein